MAETLNFRETVQRAGVSRQRLNEAIRTGRLPAARGGGPGKPTSIQLEDLQAWCVSEGLAMPVDASERLEPSQPTAIADMMARFDQMFAGMERLERLVGAVLERLERSPQQSPPQEHAPHLTEVRTKPSVHTREQIIARMQHARNVEKKSYQQIADALNEAGIPTFSGRGTWQKGNVQRLYKGI